jgi:hypothetical protein
MIHASICWPIISIRIEAVSFDTETGFVYCDTKITKVVALYGYRT